MKKKTSLKNRERQIAFIRKHIIPLIAGVIVILLLLGFGMGIVVSNYLSKQRIQQTPIPTEKLTSHLLKWQASLTIP